MFDADPIRLVRARGSLNAVGSFDLEAGRRVARLSLLDCEVSLMRCAVGSYGLDAGAMWCI